MGFKDFYSKAKQFASINRTPLFKIICQTLVSGMIHKLKIGKAARDIMSLDYAPWINKDIFSDVKKIKPHPFFRHKNSSMYFLENIYNW